MAQHNMQMQICERAIKFSKEGTLCEIASLLLIGKSTVNDIIVKYCCGCVLKDCQRKTKKNI